MWQIQKRAQAEIDAATGSRMPGAGDRPKLHYTEAALYEVLRLGTVVPTALPHSTTCDTTVGGYDVPKVDAHTHACMHARTHARSQARTHVHTRTRTQTHTHKHTHIHTHIHARTHIHTHLQVHMPVYI